MNDTNLVDWCIKKYRSILLLLLIICFLGIKSYISIPKEDNPDIQIPIVGIILTHNGIKAEDAENLLVKPMENRLKSVNNLKKMSSTSHIGGASITLEFNVGFDIKHALSDVRDKVMQARNELPKDADEPYIYEINLSELPVISIILHGNIEDKLLYSIAKQFKDSITQLNGVLKVDISGKRDELVEIIMDPITIQSLDINKDNLSFINRNNQLITAGDLKSKTGSYSIKIPGIITDVNDLSNLPIKKIGDQILKLKDYAEIRSSFHDVKSIVRVNGEKAVSLNVSKRSGVNTIEIINNIKKIVEEQRKHLPNILQVTYSQDTSEDILNSLRNLENNIILAVILALIPIVLTMGTRSAIMVSLSIPISFFIGILIIHYLGYTLNIVVIFSLILSIGMLIDASIVVCEYADRKMIAGHTAKDSFSISAKRMWWPMYMATITTLIVFAPLFFWPGIMGEFMIYMPITIIVTVSASLLVAFIFIPVLGSLLGKPDKFDHKIIESIKAAEDGDVSKLSGVTKLYAHYLNLILLKPKKFLLSIIGILCLAVIAFVTIGPGIDFFPDVESNMALIKIKANGNLSIEQKNKIALEVEENIKNMNNEIKIIYSITGHNEKHHNNNDIISIINLELYDWKFRRKADLILDEIKSRISHIPGVIIELSRNNSGPGSQGKVFNLEISSYNTKLLDSATDKIITEMKKIGGFTDIEDTRNVPIIEWQLNIDREKAARSGVDMMDISSFVQMLTSGYIITKYTPEYTDEQVDIVLRFPEDKRNLKQLDNLIINSNVGPVALSSFVKRIASKKIDNISRIDGFRTIIIKANLMADVLLDRKVHEMKEFISNNIDPNIHIKFAGEQEDQDETKEFLINAFISALLGMFFVMLIQFDNYYHTMVIMSAVFLSTTGVLLGLFITYQPFGIVMCGVGIIALAGTVVNNNIIFIDTYQILIKQNMKVKEALINTGIQRLRPILLTAFTAVLGLIPMIVGLDIDLINFDISFGSPSSQWWRQLSTTIAGGLSFATILTLFFTPCLLMVKEG